MSKGKYICFRLVLGGDFVDRLDMMIIGAEADVAQKQGNLQGAIGRLVELLQAKDIADVAFYNAYVSQAEDVRRFANDVATARRVHEALKKVKQ
jgi:hypothetical protein